MIFPAVLVLAWQYWVTYTSGEGGVALAPLAVMKSYSNLLGLKLILSTWFPLVVTIIYLKEAIKDRWLVLGWLVFAVGAGYTYLLAETGNRFAHGNFGWSGEIANFILFTSATLFFARKILDHSKHLWKRSVSLVVGLLPHLSTGVIYYIVSLTLDRFV